MAHSHDQLRFTIATACHILADQGCNDMYYGHVSARVDSSTFWLKAGRLGFEEVTPDDVILLDLDGNVLQGSQWCPLEYPIHSEVLLRRPDVGAVIHTHSKWATLFAATDEELRPFTHEGCLFLPPPIPRFTLTTDLITTPELGNAVADALGDHQAVLLRNHGVVVVGKSVEQACVATVTLEAAAQAHLLLASTGIQPLHWTNYEEALTKRRHLYTDSTLEGLWHYLARRVGEK